MLLGKNVNKDSNKSNLSIAVRWVREILAILIWIPLVVQLLLYDIIGYLVGRSFILDIVLSNRLIVLLVVLSLLLLVLGNKRFILFIGYILGYPFVLVLWHIPRMLFNNWAIFVAFSPSVYSVIIGFKYRLIAFVGALLSAVLIITIDYNKIIAVSMIYLGFYLVYHFFRRFRVAFSKYTVFTDAAGFFRNAWDKIKIVCQQESPVDFDTLSAESREKVGQKLLILYGVTTGMWYLGERLQEVVKSRKLDLYLLASLLFTFMITGILFSLECLGLERLLPRSFVGVLNPGIFDFIGLSFSTLMTSDISPLRPANYMAQLLLYTELLWALLIIVLLVFVILTSIRERYKQDLDGVISELGTASDHMREQLGSYSDITFAGVEAWLLEYSPDVTRWLLKIRHGEEKAKQIEAEVVKD